MILLDLMKLSEVRIAGDQLRYISNRLLHIATAKLGSHIQNKNGPTELQWKK